MKYVLRFWTCGKCRQPNKTGVSLNGTVTCEHCTSVTRIQTFRNTGWDASPNRLAR